MTKNIQPVCELQRPLKIDPSEVALGWYVKKTHPTCFLYFSTWCATANWYLSQVTCVIHILLVSKLWNLSQGPVDTFLKEDHTVFQWIGV